MYHGMYRTGSEMERSELDHWRNPMLLKPFHSFIALFTVFLTFDMDKLGKICQCYWKKCLNMSKKYVNMVRLWRQDVLDFAR